MTDFTNKDIEFGWLSGENGWGDGMNENLQRVSNLLLCTVVSATVTAPPGSPTDGDGYLVPTGATGVWVGHEGELAYWSALEGDWLYFTPLRGWQVTAQDTDLTYYYTGSAWQGLYARVANGIQLPGSALKLGTDASGTDAAATSVTQTAPLSTGDATPAALVWQVGVQGSPGTDPQTPTEGFRVQEVANASGREVALWNPSGTVMGGIPTDVATALLIADSGARFGTRLQAIRVGLAGELSAERVNGTWDTPTAVGTNTQVGYFQSRAYDGTSMVTVGRFLYVTREAPGPSARGSLLRVQTIPVGSTTVTDTLDFRTASGISEFVSGQPTLRLIPGATQFAIRDSGNTADTFTVNAAGTAIYAPIATAVGIGTSSNNAAAILQADSTTRGFLPPRMTTAQRDAISSPPAGLLIYNTTTNKLNVYTTAWEAITSA